MLKARIQRLKRELRVYRLVMQDQRTPRRAKWLIGLAVAYVVSPVDPIPDFIPVIGWLDELVVVPVLLACARAWIPDKVIADCRAQADCFET